MVSVNDCKVPSPVSAKQAQIITPKPLHLMLCDEVFVLVSCVWFSPNMALCIITKYLNFYLVKDYCSRSLVVCSHPTLQA